MTRVIAALIAGTALTAALPAFAADLPEPIPMAPIAEPMESTAFDWTGVYVGATAAYGWGQYGIEGSASHDVEGFTGGAFIGYNYAVMPNVIVGAEADVLFGGTESFRSGGNDVEATNTALSTVRARVGYAFDNFMVYGTGGLAVGFGEAEFNGGNDSNTHIGFAVGGGVEAALTENITARAEYLYVDTSEETYAVGAESAKADLDAHLVKFGLAYKF